MKLWKRAVTALVLIAFLASSMPVPAGAVSTATEIRMGQDGVKQVDAENVIMNDPVLNTWVNSIADNLKRYRARPDINYSFKIIDTNEINAFSLPGGFVYLNFGLLNSVGSDDELAGVMGHEMGHVERRHQITLQAKAQALNLIIGILSIFSPFAYRFGNLIGGLSLYKMSRIDEMQADQYGLLLMTRAGYDPEAMVSFMDRLEHEYGPGASGLEKYFQDHPDPKARIAHLQGYPELAKADPQQKLQQAIHDEEEGRYAFALAKLDDVLKADPQNQLALLHKGQVELALGSFDKSQVALAQVAGSAKSPDAASAAQRILAMLPKDPPASSLLNPNVQPLRQQVDAAVANAKNNQAAIDERVKLGREDLKQLNQRLDDLSYEVPNLGNIDIRPGSRMEGVFQDLEHMSKDLNVLIDKVDFITSEAPALQKDDLGVLNEMQAPLRDKSLTGETLRRLPYYGDLLSQMNTSAGDIVNSLTAARGSMALAWQSSPALDAYFRELSRSSLDFGGDISPHTAQKLKPLAIAAIQQLDTAANAAEEANKRYFSAQARQLQSRITLLGANFPEGRYDSLASAIHSRLGVDAPSYDDALKLNLSPGDVAVASWFAAEEKVPVSTVINEQRAAKMPWVDLALSKGLSQESLEVTLGMWFQGYSEKPVD
jgi:predicted Zn-dependent protease